MQKMYSDEPNAFNASVKQDANAFWFYQPENDYNDDSFCYNLWTMLQKSSGKRSPTGPNFRKLKYVVRPEFCKGGHDHRFVYPAARMNFRVPPGHDVHEATSGAELRIPYGEFTGRTYRSPSWTRSWSPSNLVPSDSMLMTVPRCSMTSETCCRFPRMNLSTPIVLSTLIRFWRKCGSTTQK